MNSYMKRNNETSKKRILVADDDMAILDSLQLLLEDAGYKVITVDSGETVLQLPQNALPDLVLLDIWMSGADGRELCKAFKQAEKTKNIPVILFSANRDIEKYAKEAGANDFIEKPFEIKTLLEKVETHIL